MSEGQGGWKSEGPPVLKFCLTVSYSCQGPCDLLQQDVKTHTNSLISSSASWGQSEHSWAELAS